MKWKDTPDSWFGTPGKVVQFVIDNVLGIFGKNPDQGGLDSMEFDTPEDPWCDNCPQGLRHPKSIHGESLDFCTGQTQDGTNCPCVQYIRKTPLPPKSPQ